MFRFIAADLRRHWIGVLAIVLIIALATALGVVVTLQERALRLGSARAAGAFDLVIGAPGSETQLVLSSVFLQAAPLSLMPGSVLASLAKDPRVAFAAPIGFGDFVEASPIIGTTQPLIDGFGGLSVETRRGGGRRAGSDEVGGQLPPDARPGPWPGRGPCRHQLSGGRTIETDRHLMGSRRAGADRGGVEGPRLHACA